MKKAVAALLIAIVCISVVGVHAWMTWGEVDLLPAGPRADQELFEYSLFLESFAFMLSAAYFVGPRIYRGLKEENAATRFEGEKEGISRTVEIYSALTVVIRRVGLDPKMGVPTAQTVIAIALICAPALWTLIKRKYAIDPREV